MNKGTLGAALVFGLVSFAACSKVERDYTSGGTAGQGGAAGSDECALGTHTCDPLVTCTDTEDGYTCGACPSGYDDVKSDGTSCQDINECDLGACDPQAPCMNTEGSFACGSCPTGLEDPNGDGTLCNAVCGSGVRAASEGCDDGNTQGGDGCSESCVVEGALTPVFASVSGLNGAWMTVSASGLIYIKDSGGGGGFDHIGVVNQKGDYYPNIIGGILSRYGGDIVAIGEDLYFGGSSATPVNTYVQQWTAKTDTTAILYSEPIIYYYGIAARDAKTFFIGHDKEIRAVNTPTTSSIIAEGNGNIIHVNPVTNHLLSATGPELIQHSGVGGPETLYTMSGGNIGDIAVGPDGTIYLTCNAPSDPPQACAFGSVWAVRPDGSNAKPIVDAFAAVRQIAWDPSTSHLVLFVGQGQILRVNLKS
jgi:cysteine-rich repeat protein